MASKYIYLGFTHPANFVFTPPSNINGELFMGYSGVNGAFEEVGLSSLNNTQPVNFTEYGSLGQLIAGNYNGQVVRERHDSTGMVSIIDTVNAVFNFRVRHTTNPF